MKETKITFSTSKIKKVSIKVPSHRTQHEVDVIIKNGGTILKIKEL